jgi:hypothetical protein
MRWSRDVTPELLAHIKYCYEETDKPVRSIAAECEVRERKIYEWVVQLGWRRRRDRPPRDVSSDLQLTLDVDRALEEAAATSAAEECEVLPRVTSPRLRGEVGEVERSETEPGEGESPRAQTCGESPSPAPSLPSPVSGEGLGRGMTSRRKRGEVSAAATCDSPPDDAAPAPVDMLAVAERLERQLEQNLARVERMREAQWPQNPADAERTTRALERLTDALLKVRRLRNPETNTADRDGADRNDFDMSGDIDEFRRAFARRIDAFVRSRTDAGVPGPGKA